MNKVFFFVGLTILIIVLYVLSRVVVISEQEESSDAFIRLLERDDFSQLSVYPIDQDVAIFSTQDKKEIKQFLDLIKINSNVGLVMSPASYRFTLAGSGGDNEAFKFVPEDYLRYEGGEDYELTEQSSVGLKKWLSTFGD